MSKTVHRPDKEELLEAMRALYGDTAEWDDMTVRYEEEGGEVVLQDPIIEFKGELNKTARQDVGGEIDEFSEARDELRDKTEEEADG